jgi:hypothetical protein
MQCGHVRPELLIALEWSKGIVGGGIRHVLSRDDIGLAVKCLLQMFASLWQVFLLSVGTGKGCSN